MVATASPVVPSHHVTSLVHKRKNSQKSTSGSISAPSHRAEYRPPAKEVLLELASSTCESFAEQFGTDFRDPEVVDGLADFLSVLAQITAKQLNQQLSAKAANELKEEHDASQLA